MSEIIYRSYENNEEKAYTVENLKEYFEKEEGLAEQKEEGTTFESWIDDLKRSGVLVEGSKNMYGIAIEKLRKEQGISLEDFASMAIMSKEDLINVEQGLLELDPNSLLLIANMFGVYAKQLEQGDIVNQQSRGELLAAMQDIKNSMNELQEDTRYFRDFMEKYKLIPQPELLRFTVVETPENSNVEKYTILDTETGVILDEYIFTNREDANEIANHMNDKDKRKGNKNIDFIEAEEKLSEKIDSEKQELEESIADSIDKGFSR